MKKEYEFLKAAETYYLATVDVDQPRVRPFGTVLIYENKLYIQTAKSKNVGKQINKNSKVEICALKDGTCLRLSGELVEDDRISSRKAMLDDYPELRSICNENDGNTEVLYFKNATATFTYPDGKMETEKL